MAVPAAVVLVALGIVPWHDAIHTIRRIGPTLGFLAAVLILGRLCADEGVFDHLGSLAARASRGNPRRLLGLVVALSAAVTITLTLDATVVLLTPVVLATAARLGVSPRPSVYACARLANSGSLLLPVSNLTNLLAFTAAGLSFGRFVALMSVPALAVVALDWGLMRWWFRRELRGAGFRAPAGATQTPVFALTVLALTVAAFVVSFAYGIAPAWAAVAGCVALVVPRLRRHDVRARRLVAAASPGFVAFVFALAVLVEGATRHGLGSALGHLVPSGASFGALLAVAALAALLANLVNNLPATLALVPVIGGGHPALMLAMLLGVNIGPNLAYPGSLATLLWRRLVPRADRPGAREFHLLGASVPTVLAVATACLWADVTLIGT